MNRVYFRSRVLRFVTCLLVLGAVALAAAPAGATPVFRTLFDLPSYSNTRLVQGNDGSFYGTTQRGGANNSGSIFKVTPSGAFTTLYSFSALSTGSPPTNRDGSFPGTLVEGGDSNFYGSASDGGPSGDGTIFKITPTGIFTVLVACTSASGGFPGPLILGSNGNFYGLGDYGTSGYGTVFQVTPTGMLTTLATFTGPNGIEPDALVQGSDGTFYGTTLSGGANETGTVFKMTPSGALTTLYSFSAKNNNGDNSDGTQPDALIEAGDGNFYGTAYTGGSYDDGTVFKITPSGTLTTLHTFSAYDAGGENSDGADPFDGVVSAPDGDFYGTTYTAGASGRGTVFKITPAGTLTTIYSFSALPPPNYTNSDGADPRSGLVLGGDGNFYGTTSNGGANGAGTIYEIEARSRTLYNFSPTVNSKNADGANPEYGPLAQGSDGDFYGTAFGAGPNNAGTAFKITPAGALTILADFTGANGANSFSGLFQATGGNFIGTTEFGGSANMGTVFQLTPAGTLTTLASFTGANGANVSASPIVGSDGSIYGTTQIGGANNTGTVYKLTPSGTLSTLHSFTAKNASGDNADGTNPDGGLFQAASGTFYGTASRGGASGVGTIFTITPAGTFTTLVTFAGPNGASPIAGLTEGSDGNLYGTTIYGGANNTGTVFKITPAGALTTLYSFSARSAGGINHDGADPHGGLTLGSDGNFYGTTADGGAFGLGTAYALTAGGVLTTLVAFTSAEGARPYCGLTLGSDGNFYGTTHLGGTGNTGTIYRLDGPPVGYGASTAVDGVVPVTFTVAFDDPTGLGITGISFPTMPSHGTITVGAISETGTTGTVTLTYTAMTNYVGPDSFTYSVTGYTGVSLPQTVNVTVRSPKSVSLMISAQTPTQATLAAKAMSGDGHPLTYTWAVSPSSTASFTAATTGSAASGATFSNTLQVSAAGTYTVTVMAVDDQNHSVSAQMAVTFQQIPATVVVSPPNSSISDQQTRQFSATVTDQFGTVFTPATLTWSAAYGSIDNTGDYSPSSDGMDTITATATNGGVTQSGTTGITVYPDPDAQISVSSMTPTTAHLSGIAVITRFGSNGTYSLSVSPSATATFTGPATGTANGPFTSALQVSRAGTYTVTLTLNDTSPYTVTTNIDITFTQQPASVAVTPASVILAQGASQTFTATVTDQFGATFMPGSLTWSVSGGGTINAATGVFTAGTEPGTYTVTATAVSGGVTQTGTVTVTVTGSFHTPTITGFTPASGPVGTTVTITGTNLGGTTVVGFQGKHATSFTVNGAGTQITTTVPAGAMTGPVAVATPGGTAKSSASFTVTAPPPAPIITGFTPASGPVGTTVTITGTNLTGTTVVGFMGKHATSFSVNGAGTQITTTVPAGAVTGPIAVLTNGVEAKSSTGYTVMP